MILTLLFGSDTKICGVKILKAKAVFVSVFPSSFPLRLSVFLMLAVLVAGCTQSQNTVETALTPQPTQSTPETLNGNQVQANALADGTQSNPTQNVTEAQLATQTTPEPNTQIAALNTSQSLTFLPIEGAPTTAVTDLTKSLRASADQKGLSILPATQSGAKYQIKGYFSALNDGSGTLVVYVWDVLDSSGKRLHRINGQERTGDSKPNPWLAITDVELERVSDRTTDSLKAWIDNKKS